MCLVLAAARLEHALKLVSLPGSLSVAAVRVQLGGEQAIGRCWMVKRRNLPQRSTAEELMEAVKVERNGGEKCGVSPALARLFTLNLAARFELPHKGCQ